MGAQSGHTNFGDTSSAAGVWPLPAAPTRPKKDQSFLARGAVPLCIHIRNMELTTDVETLSAFRSVC